MQDLAKLCDYAQAEIDTLIEKGVTLTPRDIVAINALAWAVESPESRVLLSRGVPVFVGGITLWPLTMYAAEWYRRVGCELIGNQARTLALAYAMAHGREDGALDMGRAKAEWVVSQFNRSFFCTGTELVEAIAQVLQQDEQPEEPPALGNENSMSAGELSAFLVANAGGPIEMWERQCSIGYVCAMMTAIVQQNKADGKPSLADPKIRATRALAWYTECLLHPELRNTANG
ncbi:MAG TPA: hypothetical protein DCY07_02530 [Rhodospirillaceae bacterium]|nr:hypothetical protein [Rhodospirillaceae bacterium]